MYSSYELKDKYPYWWANKEREDREREIRYMLDTAKLELDMFVKQKMREIENQIKDIVIRVQTQINGRPANIEAINAEIKKMLYDELKRSFK